LGGAGDLEGSATLCKQRDSSSSFQETANHLALFLNETLDLTTTAKMTNRANVSVSIFLFPFGCAYHMAERLSLTADHLIVLSSDWHL
jgi:hypothetical protein